MAPKKEILYKNYNLTKKMDILVRWIVLCGAAVTFGIGAVLVDHLPVGDIRWDKKKEFLAIPFMIGTLCLSVWWSFQAARDLFENPVVSAFRLVQSLALLSGTLLLYVVLMYYEFMLYSALFLPFGFFLSFWLAEDVYTYISRPSRSVKQRERL